MKYCFFAAKEFTLLFFTCLFFSEKIQENKTSKVIVKKKKSWQYGSEYFLDANFPWLSRIWSNWVIILKSLWKWSCSFVSDSCDHMDCSLPGSFIHGIFQARVLEWVAISFSRGSFPTQGLNPGLPHCRRVLYQLSHRGNSSVLRNIV